MPVTVDTINEEIQDWIENDVPISPGVWLDRALKMNSLLGREHAALYILQEAIAQKRVALMEEGFTAAKANIYAEALPEFKQMRQQKAKIDQVQETIRLAKKQATLKADEWRGYG